MALMEGTATLMPVSVRSNLAAPPYALVWRVQRTVLTVKMEHKRKFIPKYIQFSCPYAFYPTFLRSSGDR